MARIRRLEPNSDQVQNWKREALPNLGKTAKPIVEVSRGTSRDITHPQTNWLSRGSILFRLQLDLANPRTEWDPEFLSKKIRNESSPNTIFFADTNLFSVPIEFPIWDAILTRKLAITPMVRKEMEPWLSNPRNNLEIRDLVAEAEIKTIPKIEFATSSDLVDLSYDYYFKLISHRKQHWRRVVSKYNLSHGRMPTDQETIELLRKDCGDFSTLAIKGWKDRDKPGLFADEELATIAVLTSIVRGVDVVILSSDNDLSSRFIELCSLIAGHYYSMCAADHIWAQRDEFEGLFPPKLQPPADGRASQFSTGPVSGIGFPEKELKYLLPTNPIPVLMHCVTFDTSPKSRKYSVVSFFAETGIRRLLELKVRLNGKNSEYFGEYNCNITSGLPNHQDSVMFSVFKDKHEIVDGVKIAAIDLVHATSKKHRVVHNYYEIR